MRKHFFDKTKQRSLKNLTHRSSFPIKISFLRGPLNSTLGFIKHMTNFAFYASFFITAISAVAIYFRTKKHINSAVISTKLAKNRYLPLVLLFGVLSGLVLFPTLVFVFNYFGFPSTYGHGEVLIAAPVFNFLFALVIGIVGRVVLSWEPMQW